MRTPLELSTATQTRTVVVGDTVIVGTAADCDMVVAATGLGGPHPRHARIRHDGQTWKIYDLGTGTPTLVNNATVGTSQTLNGSGTIQLGTPPGQVTFNFKTGGSTGG